MKNDHDIFGDIVLALSLSMDMDESAQDYRTGRYARCINLKETL